MSIIRLVITIVLTVILLQQAQRSRDLVWRRRAMLLGAGAFGLLVLLNLLGLIAFDIQDISMVVIGLVALLLLGSVVMLFQSYRAGEMQRQRVRMEQTLRNKRNEREGGGPDQV